MSSRVVYVEAPGARLAVDVDGDGPPAVLLCHGGPGGPDDFAEVRALLAAWDVPCARFDQRGVCRSSNTADSWDIEDHATDVEAIRQALGAERLVVFGHSWGGVVARAYAKRFPQRVGGLLLVSPSAAIGSDWAAMEREVLAFVRSRVSASAWAALGLWSLGAMLPGPIGDAAMGRMFAAVLRAYTGETETPAWVWCSSARAASQTRRALRGRSPTMLDDLELPPDVPARALFGAHDIYGPFAQRFADAHPRIETVFLAGCGHVAWHDAPEAFASWLRDGLTAAGVLDAA